MIKGAPSEFDLISRFFAPLSGEGAWNLTNDAARLPLLENGLVTVISTDTIVENVHFFSDDPPDLIAQKALRVNISDCAAMGARPSCYLLNLTLPTRCDLSFLELFAEGLRRDQSRYGVSLIGGDTTRTEGPLVITASVTGIVAEEDILTRSGARPGDEIWVSGVIGASWLGLQGRMGKLDRFGEMFLARYRCPEPRPELIPNGLAHACLDISDGLLQDAGHIARQSDVVLEINAEDVPLPAVLSPTDRNTYLMDCLTGGDDYELLFTCPAGAEDRLREASHEAGVPLTRIGIVRAGQASVHLLDTFEQPIALGTRKGWQHF